MNRSNPKHVERQGRLCEGHQIKMEGWVFSLGRELFGWGVFVFVLLLALNHCACVLGPHALRVEVGEEFDASQAVAVETEVREAFDWYLEYRGLGSKREELEYSLLIRVVGIPFQTHRGGEFYNGLYVRPNRITIRWMGGIGYNALLHELMHHELAHTGPSHATDFDGPRTCTGHTAEFCRLDSELSIAWVKYRARQIQESGGTP